MIKVWLYTCHVLVRIRNTQAQQQHILQLNLIAGFRKIKGIKPLMGEDASLMQLSIVCVSIVI
jgi:hypothetical protein